MKKAQMIILTLDNGYGRQEVKAIIPASLNPQINYKMVSIKVVGPFNLPEDCSFEETRLVPAEAE